MTRYLVIDVSTGEIVRTSLCAVPPAAGDGLAAVEHDTARPSTHYLKGDALLAYSDSEAAAKAARPSPWVAWSNELMSWVDQRPAAERLAEMDSGARAARAVLLAQSDWTQLPDAIGRLGADRAVAWVAYRQALCDITAQAGYPADIVWPAAPVA